jgi:ZIP family zinc transporter
VPAAWAVWFFEPLLPAGLGFAAGAMMYLVVDELLATAFEGGRAEVISLSYMTGLIGMAMLGRVVGLN